LLFDGTLGDRKTKLVSFPRKEGASVYHSQVFLYQKYIKTTIIKKVEKLCKLGVLERQPEKYLSNFREVNKRLVRKPFPIPKNKYGIARVIRIHFCNSPRSKHGLLHH
jgi:hypothetical protein